MDRLRWANRPPSIERAKSAGKTAHGRSLCFLESAIRRLSVRANAGRDVRRRSSKLIRAELEPAQSDKKPFAGQVSLLSSDSACTKRMPSFRQRLAAVESIRT